MALTLFATFVAGLERRYGDDAAELRHELFFQRGGLWGKGRAWAALLRDARMLTRPLRPCGDSDGPRAVLVATLAGNSGWGTLARALPAIAAAGLSPLILAHPRVPDEVFPASLPVSRPGGIGWLSAALAVGGGGGKLALARRRRRLWETALADALAGQRGVLVLHNDFDMMSAASLSLGWPSICLQHGIPTDEFFPCRADEQVVWGATSVQAFALGGLGPSRFVVDALGRSRERQAAPQLPPARVAVVSQTHATIFGPDLAEDLRRFVDQLQAMHGNVVALLHPGEQGRHPYGALSVSHPPHVLLARAAEQPALVLAHCSTLLVEAALAGHWVAGIAFDRPGNDAAHMVADPPLRVADATEAFALHQRLRDDAAFRRRIAAEQDLWLQATFHETGELVNLLRKVVEI